MKRLLFLFFCWPLLSVAQNSPLIIEGVSPAFYIMHTVQPKENYYSIGRMYNISPKDIAPLNKLELGNGLSLGQVIKIPLTSANFVQAGKAAPDETLVPLHHTVHEKEGLYRIALNYNKLPQETLKKWNNIKGDAVATGTPLIVGYLKVKKAISPLATGAKPKQNVLTETSQPAATAPNSNKTPQPVVTKTPEPKKDIPVKTGEPAQPANTVTTGKNFNGGYFKSTYDKQSKKETSVNENGAAAVFKSNSGWEDGKYYCLHNAAAPGTVIKITSVETGKTIYAKVLDVIPDIKQNNGLLIRISNAASQELGTGDTKFNCTLSYAK